MINGTVRLKLKAQLMGFALVLPGLLSSHGGVAGGPMPPLGHDLVLGQPFACFVPDIQQDDFVVPLETYSRTPSSNFVDGNEFTFVYSEYNFDCYSSLPERSAFTAVRISWKEGAWTPAVLSWDCDHYGVGSWRLSASDDREIWTELAREDDALVNPEDVTLVSGEGSFLKLEVRMANCPPIGGYTFSVFGHPLTGHQLRSTSSSRLREPFSNRPKLDRDPRCRAARSTPRPSAEDVGRAVLARMQEIPGAGHPPR